MSKITLIAYCLVACAMVIVTINNFDPWRPNNVEIQQTQIPNKNPEPEKIKAEAPLTLKAERL